jgi:hypothetical protein
VLTFADMVHFLAHKFTGLRAERFAFLFVLASFFNHIFFGHFYLREVFEYHTAMEWKRGEVRACCDGPLRVPCHQRTRHSTWSTGWLSIAPRESFRRILRKSRILPS